MTGQKPGNGRLTRLLLSGIPLYLWPTAPAEAQDADLILTNGRVFTTDLDHPWSDVLAVRGERIAAVGAQDVEGLATSGARAIDLEGRLVVPGINDAHVHVGPSPDAVLLEVAAPNPTWDEVVASLEAAVPRTEPGRWIGAVVGPTLLDDARADRFALDRLAPENPVYLYAFTGHGLILNSAGLRRIGIPSMRSLPIRGAPPTWSSPNVTRGRSRRGCWRTSPCSRRTSSWCRSRSCARRRAS